MDFDGLEFGVHDPVFTHAVACIEFALHDLIGFRGTGGEDFDDKIRRPLLSKYLGKLKAGERIVLCKRNQPVAQITPLSVPPTRPRPIGLAKRTFSVPASLFEPIPNELLHAFEGEKA
jgi:antitoxin (DNA-binding transcriptional repressor) of toxin-antitoxin stability system